MSFFAGIAGVKTITTIRAEVGGVKVAFRREGVLEGTLQQMAEDVGRSGKLSATVKAGHVAGAVVGTEKSERTEGSGAAARSMLLKLREPVAPPTEPTDTETNVNTNGVRRRTTAPAA